MQKLYTKNSNREYQVFGLVALFLIILTGLLFHPTLGIFQKFQHKQKVDQLISDIQKPEFKMREYWEFREFYSPGNFTYDPEIVTLAGALQFNQIPSPTATLLTFNSPLLSSKDSIIDINSSNDYSQLHPAESENQKILFKSKDTFAYQTNDQKIHFVFVRSADEMKQTLGLFDYGGAEDKVLKTKVWLNETTLSD